MATTDYYLLRMTATEREVLLNVLTPLAKSAADDAIVKRLHRRLLDAEPHGPGYGPHAVPMPDPPRTVVTANPEGNLPWPQIAEAVGPKYLPVGNATADPPGKHPHLASREQILERAERLISHDRAQTYGDARESFKRIGLLWSDIIGTPITATDVARMMIAMKLSRLTRDPAHADSWVDIAGYAALGAEIAEVEL